MTGKEVGRPFEILNNLGIWLTLHHGFEALAFKAFVRNSEEYQRIAGLEDQVILVFGFCSLGERLERSRVSETGQEELALKMYNLYDLTVRRAGMSRW